MTGPAFESGPLGTQDQPTAYADPATSAPVHEGDAVPARSTPAPGFNQKGKVATGRISGLWVGLIATAIFIILLVIFIAQNSRQTSIHFLGLHGQFSVGLTILISAVVGVLLVAIPGSVRILQLRHALRKNVPADKRK